MPLARDAAVGLFLERARAVRPDFQPEAPELDAIAEICGHVDDLPLAIELAATRVKVLTPSAMLARLERRLELLTSGSRDAPLRHRALRDTIDWSVELLDDDERALFRRLSVFVGRMHARGGGGGVRRRSRRPRLARRQEPRPCRRRALRHARDDPRVRGRAARRRVPKRKASGARMRRITFASSGLPRRVLAASDQAAWRTTLEADHDNLRAALRFSLDIGDQRQPLQLCASLWRFWLERGYLSEGRLWLEESLAGSSEASEARARALSGNCVLAHYQGDYDRAEELCREALELSRSLNDARGVAEACTGLALVTRTRGDYASAEKLFREALDIYESLGDERGVARALDRLAMCLVVAGEMDRARPLFERSLGIVPAARRFARSRARALRSGSNETVSAPMPKPARMQTRASTSCAPSATDARTARRSGRSLTSMPTSVMSTRRRRSSRSR